MYSKLIDTSIGEEARQLYNLNNLQYHNFKHVLSCYNYLQCLPYSSDLDYAVLYHDIVYDADQCKEQRSARLLLDKFPDEWEAARIIMKTLDHRIVDTSDTFGNAMVRADLHELSDSFLATKNYYSILAESKQLYRITAADFAHNNISFMEDLAETCYKNKEVDTGYSSFWENVLEGINTTIYISESFIEQTK